MEIQGGIKCDGITLPSDGKITFGPGVDIHGGNAAVVITGGTQPTGISTFGEKAHAGKLLGSGTLADPFLIAGTSGNTKAMSFYVASASVTATHILEGLYVNVAFGVGATSAAPYGDAGRFRGWLLGDAAGGTIAGSHSTVEWGQAGATNTGLTVGARGNLVFVNSTAGGGTMCGVQAELNSGGTSTDVSGATCSILRMIIDGAVTAAQFTVPAISIVLPAGLVGDGLVFDNASTTAHCAGKLRILVNGVEYWILCDTAHD